MNLQDLFEGIPRLLGPDDEEDLNTQDAPKQRSNYAGELRAVHFLQKHRPLSPNMLAFAKKHFKNADPNFEDVTINEYDPEWYVNVFGRSNHPLLNSIRSWGDLWDLVLRHYYVEKRKPKIVKEEQLDEARGGVLRYIQQQFPGWPDYVIKDFVLGRVNKAVRSGYPTTQEETAKAKQLATRGDGTIDLEKYQEIIAQYKEQKWAESLIPHIQHLKQQYPIKKWTKSNTLFTFDSWDSATQSKLAQMAGEDPQKLADKIPRHTARIGTQQSQVEQYGHIKEPIIVILHPRKSINDPLGGFELLEGHHRIVAMIRQYGKMGFYAPAYIGHL
jgi:hypothetical protein